MAVLSNYTQYAEVPAASIREREMSELVLSDYQTALRAAHEQVQVLEHIYKDAEEDASDRLAELLEYREALRAALREEDILPTQPDPEREALKRLLESVQSALGDGDHSQLTQEEQALDDLGRDLEACPEALSPAIQNGIARTRRAAGRSG
ncbi:MAG: hypothetical protein KJO19_03650 [Woeseia sp.]|nr:hypothetical protein [Woeseia sp.]